MKTYWQPINEYAGDTRHRFIAIPTRLTRFGTWARIGVPATFNPTSIKWPEEAAK